MSWVQEAMSHLLRQVVAGSGLGWLSELLAAEAASEDDVLNVSKVASNSSDGVPCIGHNRSYVRV